MFVKTTATKKVLGLKKRIKAVQGGTSASKTISILLVLIAKAQSDKKPTLTSIVSESFPHLKRGSMRDFLNIMQEHNYFDDNRWNKSDFTYTFETGSKIEFFSADQPSKVRGPRRDRLFVNEANNIHFESFEQLEVRTKKEIYLDWNPTNEFWFYTEVLPYRTDVDHLIITYKDNEALDEEIVKSIEMREPKTAWWRVYGMGLLGEVEGKIYRDWKIIKEVPHEARLVVRGLDFGYTNDPTAIVDVYYYNGGYIFDEILYRKGYSNLKIGDHINNQHEDVMTIADCAEPKSIDQIREMGVNIIACKKGPGSINQGIQFVQDQQISVTNRSLNVIKEYRNYLWATDKLGKGINKPEGGFDHAMDAIRYALATRDVTSKGPMNDVFEEEEPLFADIGM